MVKRFTQNIQRNLEKGNLTPMAKKRSAKLEIVIDSKSYELHEIHWLDIVGDSTIASADEFAKMKCAEMVSEAYIWKKDKEFLYIFSSYQKNDVGFGDRNIIPLGCIKDIRKKAL